MKYKITNQTAGVEFGIYEADSLKEALDIMAKQAGYANWEESALIGKGDYLAEINVTDVTIPTLETLNKNDNPKDFDGECLGDDGQGNELWLFRSIEKLANRYEDEETGDFEWTNDIAGWNYNVDEFGLD